MKAVAYLCISSALVGSTLVLAGPPTGREDSPVKACSSISLAQPGYGVRYEGEVRNSDYRLRLVIPVNLVGWGAADSAPFHGFTIFLPDGGTFEACLEFEIHLRVDLNEGRRNTADHERPRHRVGVGNTKGWREERVGYVDGIAVKNVLVSFSVKHEKEIHDGKVWLVTPLAAAAKNTAILNTFLSQMCFESAGKGCVH